MYAFMPHLFVCVDSVDVWIKQHGEGSIFLRYGIEPLVTISHYETPFHLAKTYNGISEGVPLGRGGRRKSV